MPFGQKTDCAHSTAPWAQMEQHQLELLLRLLRQIQVECQYKLQHHLLSNSVNGHFETKQT